LEDESENEVSFKEVDVTSSKKSKQRLEDAELRQRKAYASLQHNSSAAGRGSGVAGFKKTKDQDGKSETTARPKTVQRRSEPVISKSAPANKPGRLRSSGLTASRYQKFTQ
jgi:hypothetical protein